MGEAEDRSARLGGNGSLDIGQQGANLVGRAPGQVNEEDLLAFMSDEANPLVHLGTRQECAAMRT